MEKEAMTQRGIARARHYRKLRADRQQRKLRSLEVRLLRKAWLLKDAQQHIKEELK
jgi:hypothetical protein